MTAKKHRRVLTKQDLITKYEKELNSMIIMDDYDGGKANCMRTVIEDLKSSVCNEADKELDY
jgi:hypothetical protein|tara:strand:+ start:682 stop:867 length:186 start_codon:yes stop_codon:yes gene_type:complete